MSTFVHNWKHRLRLESARAALCKWATCTRQTFLSKTFANSLGLQKQNALVVDKSTGHDKPHFDLFFTTMSTSKKTFFFRTRAKKVIAWHIDASSVVWTLKDFCCSSVSMLCYKTNGKRHSVYYWVMVHLGGLLSTQEARVALGCRLVRLLRFFRA